MNKLPGYEEAYKLGYTLYSHSGDKQSATYTKYSLCLTVYANNTAKLSSYYKMVEISIGPIAFPHKNIKLFEIQINTCNPAY